jgi:exopolysaccharide production protein ExoY
MRDYEFTPDLASSFPAAVPVETFLRSIDDPLEAVPAPAAVPQRAEAEPTDPFTTGLVASACETIGYDPLGGIAKRAFDIVLASIAFILLAPLMVVVSALIRIFLGGPVVFSQERIGFAGTIFTCYKFRTMVVNADEVLRRHLAANPEAAREWQATRKLRNDPRVTCLGRVLRKSSIDELPQLYNVLRGEMSLVGPRPVVAEELKYYGRYLRYYLKARPGLTGIWQTGGRNQLNYRQRVVRDTFYVRRWSIRLDFAMLMKTLPALLSFDETA